MITDMVNTQNTTRIYLESLTDETDLLKHVITCDETVGGANKALTDAPEYPYISSNEKTQMNNPDAFFF